MSASTTSTSPTVEVTQQQASTAHPGHGSVGPTIAVLAVLTILGVIAGMIGRLCSGRPIMGRGGQYDFEAWAERKCSSCIDGHVGPHQRPPRPVPRPDDGGSAEAEAAVGEVKPEGEEEPPAETVQPQQPPREQRASRGDNPES